MNACDPLMPLPLTAARTLSPVALLPRIANAVVSSMNLNAIAWPSLGVVR